MAHNFRERDVIRNIGAVPELELYPSLSDVESIVSYGVRRFRS